LKVSSDLSELDLSLAQEERVEFVEVFSEQGVQLLFFPVSQRAAAEDEQWAEIQLSEGRTLEACLRLENGPRLHVTYREPEFEDEALPASLKLVKEEPLSSPQVSAAAARSRFGRLLRMLGSLAHHRAPDRDTIGTLPTINGGNTGENRSESKEIALLGLASPLTRKPFWTRPEWLTVLVSILLVGAFLVFKDRIAPAVTAAKLLDQARVAEEMTARVPDEVTHRFINLEERRSAEGAVVSRRRIEIWQNSTRGERAQRLYDESNHLIAGVWQKGDGSRTVYHHGAGAHAQPTPAQADNLLLNLDDIWQLEPSAKEFSSLIAGIEESKVEERPAGYVISSGKERAVGSSRLIKATLTLSRTDLHAIEQTVLVERNGEVREYRFVEASFERLPQKSVAPAVFMPEPELMGKTGASSGRLKEEASPNVASLPGPSSTDSSAVRAASAELEVDVAYLLNQAKADRSEQVTLTRTSTGLLRVEGVVDSEQRKQELLSALAPVSNNPAVKIEICTITEAAQRQRGPSGPITVREAEVTVDEVAVDRELREYLSKKDSSSRTGEGLDEAVRSFSSRVVNRAYRALFHAIELKRLVNRFNNVDMRTVTPDARAKWLQMVREHAAALGRETAVLRQEIEPIFSPGASLNAADEPEATSDADLARAVEKLHRLALANNEAIRAAFTISSQSSNAVRSPQFWRSLIGAEKLAAQVKEYGAF